MRIGCFQLHEPVPQLHEPYVIATVRPWIDVNGVGTMVLSELKRLLDATEFGLLVKPGHFYDFTRYRPVVNLDNGIRDLSIPTTSIYCARREGNRDIVLLRLLEPHAHAEFYVDSVLKLLKTLGAKRYILVGSMHDLVPHTRPLLVNGYGMGKEAVQDVRKAGVLPIVHRGPSTILNLIPKKAAESGIDAIALIVSLPQYVGLERDYQGKVRLMEILDILYGIPIGNEDYEKALEQRRQIAEQVDESSAIKAILPQLETAYDLRVNAGAEADIPRITSDMDDVLWGMTEKDIGEA